jgi:hypothetical protein
MYTYAEDMHTGLSWGNMKKTDHWEDPRVDEMIILKLIFNKWDGAWTGWIWLRTGTGGGIL